MELGEAALRALFGFILEGRRDPDDADPFGIHLHGFRVTDPSGREQAEREALQAMARQMRLRRFTFGPDGALRETTDGG